MKYHAIIVAGGTGTRMHSNLPKQFLCLNGEPIVMHTIRRFYNSDYQPNIVLVLNASFHLYWKELCINHKFQIPHTLVAGGANRFDSVKKGLESISEDFSIIAIHDAVRPLIDNKLITGAFEQAEIKGSAVAMIQSKDSVRRITSNASEALNRSEIYLVQTPQTFKSELLRQAYLQNYNPAFTDDASVVEKAGFPIFPFPGDDRNIKITYPDDLVIGEVLLNQHK